MERLTKTEIKWTVDALQLTIGYYEQVMQRSTNQMERGMAKLQAENLGSVKSKLERVLSSGSSGLRLIKEDFTMAKLTRAQYEKWNGQLGGGFKFDMMHYVTWGEKQAIRDIKLEDGRILRATVGYRNVVEHFRTVAQQPTIHVQVYEPIEGTDMMRGHGMGYTVDEGMQQAKKNYGVLCKITFALDDGKLIALMEQGREKLNSPYIM